MPGHEASGVPSLKPHFSGHFRAENALRDPFDRARAIGSITARA
jgi:hypothetical protein